VRGHFQGFPEEGYTTKPFKGEGQLQLPSQQAEQATRTSQATGWSIMQSEALDSGEVVLK